MGQYYKPVKLNDEGRVDGWLYSHDYDNGLKLMEHSYIGNNFVGAVESLLIPSGAWHNSPIVWAGDYADALQENGVELKDADGYDITLYSLCNDNNKLNPQPLENAEQFRYLVNFDKKQYVDKQACEEFEEGWAIHPLPLLTADGNGRGGGDFRGDNDYVGFWSGDCIGLVEQLPEGFEEINPSFIE